MENHFQSYPKEKFQTYKRTLLNGVLDIIVVCKDTGLIIANSEHGKLPVVPCAPHTPAADIMPGAPIVADYIYYEEV